MRIATAMSFNPFTCSFARRIKSAAINLRISNYNHRCPSIKAFFSLNVLVVNSRSICRCPIKPSFCYPTLNNLFSNLFSCFLTSIGYVRWELIDFRFNLLYQLSNAAKTLMKIPPNKKSKH